MTAESETSISLDEIDHVNIKIFAQESSSIDLSKAVPIFHRWIQDSVLSELLIDVADYEHVPAGPGVMLIAHEANYSLDCRSNRLGLLYNPKLASEGTAVDKILKSFGSALGACRRLEDEPAFQGNLHFDAGHLEVTVNDRLLAPNTEQTWQALKPVFKQSFNSLFGPETFSIEHIGEPRELFRVEVQTNKPVEVRSLVEAFQPV